MRQLILATAALAALASPAFSEGLKGFKLPAHAALANPIVPGETWELLREDVTAASVLLNADDLLAFDAPVTAFDAATVPFTVSQRLGTDQRITAMTIVVDENPAPIAARFEFGPLMGEIHFESRVRYDIYSNIRVLAETETGGTYMTGRFVQAAGGCSAAVTRDLAEALSTIGQMKLKHFDVSGLSTQASGTVKRAQLMIRHPNFTGMQVHKGTLDYIDLRYIDSLEVTLGDEVLFTMSGGFSISENPSFRFNYTDNGASQMHVRARDTAGAVFEHSFTLASGS